MFLKSFKLTRGSLGSFRKISEFTGVDRARLASLRYDESLTSHAPHTEPSTRRAVQHNPEELFLISPSGTGISRLLARSCESGNTTWLACLSKIILFPLHATAPPLLSHKWGNGPLAENKRYSMKITPKSLSITDWWKCSWSSQLIYFGKWCFQITKFLLQNNAHFVFWRRHHQETWNKMLNVVIQVF